MNSKDDVNYVWISFQVIDLGGKAINSSQMTSTEVRYGAKLETVFRKWNGEKLYVQSKVCVFLLMFLNHM